MVEARLALKKLGILHFITLAMIFVLLAICIIQLPAGASAASGPAVGQALMDAMPTLSDLPDGYQFKPESSGTSNLAEGYGGSHASWTGRKSYDCYNVKTKVKSTANDHIRIQCYANYSENINDSYPQWSADKLRALHLSQDENGHYGVPYQGLPGGVIVEYTETDSSGTAHIFARLFFWKSKYCTGDMYIQYGVYTANSNITCQTSFAERVAAGKVFCRSQIERLSKLIYSRMPEDRVGSIGSTVKSVPPAGASVSQDSGQFTQDGADGTGESGTLPDAALPAAVGATAVLTGLGALAVAFTSGVNPKEALEELINLFRGGISNAGLTDAVETPVQATFDQAAYDRAVYNDSLKQLQDDVERSKDALDRRLQYIESLRQAGQMEQADREAATLGELQREVSRTQQQLSDFGGLEVQHVAKQNTFNIGEDLMAKARQDVAAANAGSLSDLQRMKINDWIDMQAPDEQTADRMRAMVEQRTVMLGDGKTVGNFESITGELGQMLQQSSQPDLSYVERFSIRDEFMDNAKLYGDVRGKAQDAAGTAGGITDISGQGKFNVVGETTLEGVTQKLDAVAKVSDALGYLEGYTKGAGDSAGYAAVKAAVQMGVKQAALGNPVVGLGDTAIKYVENAVLGRDASPGKALETIVNAAFDAGQDVKDRVPVNFNSETGKFEMGAGVVESGSPEMTQRAARSMLAAVEKQMDNPALSTTDRAMLSNARDDLLKTINELEGR